MNDAAILLATANARYSHTAFGLRWIRANLGSLRPDSRLIEFNIGQDADHMTEVILAAHPRIVGLGVYVWNVEILTRVAQTLKAVRPDLILVIGGPEVSHEFEAMPVFAAADYLVRGEGERAFPDLARAILAGGGPPDKVVEGGLPDLDTLRLPYDEYTEEDIERRLIYVETSRGCPFRCEFCLSSLDGLVREFASDPFLNAVDGLLERGARQFKFVDRTFNLRAERVVQVLDFFQARWRDGMRLHFEIVPDRLDEPVLRRMARFPEGGLHLEIGVQTFSEAAQAAISRRQDFDRTERALRFLRQETGALLHADLVAGLPCETWDTLAGGFDRLIALAPHAIQVGILKRLRGAPISRHIGPHRMVFAERAPYEILQTDLLSFEQMQRIKRFARFFDLYHNAGNFPRSLPLLWRTNASAFEAFMGLSDAIWAATGRTHQLPLAEQARHLYERLVAAGADTSQAISEAIAQDFRRLPGRYDKLPFLCEAPGGHGDHNDDASL